MIASRCAWCGKFTAADVRRCSECAQTVEEIGFSAEEVADVERKGYVKPKDHYRRIQEADERADRQLAELMAREDAELEAMRQRLREDGIFR